MHSLSDLLSDIPLISEAILYPNFRNKKEGYAALLRIKEAIVTHVKESQQSTGEASSSDQFKAEATKLFNQYQKARQSSCR